jgi:hypothetical protein
MQCKLHWGRGGISLAVNFALYRGLRLRIGRNCCMVGTVPSAVIDGAGTIPGVLWMTFFLSLRKLDRLSHLEVENGAGSRS